MTILCFLILAAFFTKVGCGKAEGESGCWRMNRWEDKGTSYLLTQNAQHSNARLIDSCLLSKLDGHKPSLVPDMACLLHCTAQFGFISLIILLLGSFCP
ncbi:uncharacterized protein LOC113462425 isoform X2 [Phoenix dactylifera]|uniref:Uncharacterized protein LOC113462425 isoform X2 n=1 Tax=Phoenix dactylifera TaxID=42345 RepID=A0A8B9AIW6_PHODC|nr:uncharacterized protein LOC113462425 isoform X2 [Phoenix dactylifera]